MGFFKLMLNSHLRVSTELFLKVCFHLLSDQDNLQEQIYKKMSCLVMF